MLNEASPIWQVQHGHTSNEQASMNRRDVMKWSALGLTAQALPSHSFASDTQAAGPRRVSLPWRHAGESLRLAVTRQPAAGDAVLYVHGATFPAALSVAWKMDGVSWMDQLQAAGLDAWAFDFAGYGGSDRPRLFEQNAMAAAPFGQCVAAAEQIVAVLQHIRRERPGVPIHMIAHSWGTLPAQQAAIDRAELVSRLVLFGPVVTRDGAADTTQQPAWALVTAEQQRPRQRSGLPDHAATPVSDEELDRWCAAYLNSDPTASQRAPRSAKVPNGPGADIGLLWSGKSIVDSSHIRQPTLIVRGEWDHITTDADAKRLFDALSGTRDKRDVKISGGNHWLHLQPRRRALWAEALSFLREGARTSP
jgi:pimeloyl-ACP methyl ester carboxylesterase